MTPSAPAFPTGPDLYLSIKVLPQFCSEIRFKFFIEGFRAFGWRRQERLETPSVCRFTLSHPYALAIRNLVLLCRHPSSSPPQVLCTCCLLSLEPSPAGCLPLSSSQPRNPTLPWQPSQSSPPSQYLNFLQSPSSNLEAVTGVWSLCPDWQCLHLKSRACLLFPVSRAPDLNLALNRPSKTYC